MPISVEGGSSFRRWRFGFAALVVIAIAAGIYFWFDQSDSDEPSKQSPKTSTTVFGPGGLTGSTAGTSLSAQIEEYHGQPPNGVAANASQQLEVNTALLDVINFFLLEQAEAERVNALQAYLKSKLPAPAFIEAMHIVEHYRAYMKAHDDLLAGQNLGGADIDARMQNIERIATWRDQRDRLRLNMLGDQVVQAWYQNDDAQLIQTLEELKLRHDNANTGQGQTAGEQADDYPRVSAGRHSVSNSEQHDLEMQEVLNKATKSYATLAREGEQWTVHFAAYMVAANQLNQQTNLSVFERNSKIQELLQKTFPTEAERRRARDQGP